MNSRPSGSSAHILAFRGSDDCPTVAAPSIAGSRASLTTIMMGLVHYATIDPHDLRLEIQRVEYDHLGWADQLDLEGVDDLFTIPIRNGVWTCGILSMPPAERVLRPRPIGWLHAGGRTSRLLNNPRSNSSRLIATNTSMPIPQAHQTFMAKKTAEQEWVERLKALADQTRLRMVRVLIDGSKSVGELAESLEISP